MLGSLLGSLPGSLAAVQNGRILEKTRRRGPGVPRRERTRSPAGCNHGDESCVTRFFRGTDEKRRGIPATVRKVVWQGFPGERTRSAAGFRNVNESCVASLFFFGVGGSGRRPSRIRRPRRGARGVWVCRDTRWLAATAAGPEKERNLPHSLSSPCGILRGFSYVPPKNLATQLSSLRTLLKGHLH